MAEVQMLIRRVLIRDTDSTQVVELKEKDGERLLPILIGHTEASAIERRLMGHVIPRPQTHELLASVIEKTGYALVRVQIQALKQQTFYAQIHLQSDETKQILILDARPSDALALASSDDEVEIWVETSVLDQAS